MNSDETLRLIESRLEDRQSTVSDMDAISGLITLNEHDCKCSFTYGAMPLETFRFLASNSILRNELSIPNMQFLVLGSGTGRIPMFCSVLYPGMRRYCGVEIVQDQVDLANSLSLELGIDTVYMCGDASTLNGLELDTLSVIIVTSLCWANTSRALTFLRLLEESNLGTLVITVHPEQVQDVKAVYMGQVVGFNQVDKLWGVSFKDGFGKGVDLDVYFWRKEVLLDQEIDVVGHNKRVMKTSKEIDNEHNTMCILFS